MLRTVLLSLVLTLAIGPTGPLVCAAWCHPHDTATAACPHEHATTGSRVMPDDRCSAAPFAATAFVRDDGRRGSPAAGVDSAMAFARRAVDPPRIDRAGAQTAAALRPDGSPPLLIALRI